MLVIGIQSAFVEQEHDYEHEHDSNYLAMDARNLNPTLLDFSVHHNGVRLCIHDFEPKPLV